MLLILFRDIFFLRDPADDKDAAITRDAAADDVIDADFCCCAARQR